MAGQLSESFQRISDVLRKAWDPIGVADIPQVADEYDDYVPRIISALRMNASEEEIAEILVNIEVQEMRLSGDPRRAADVARSLVALKPLAP